MINKLFLNSVKYSGHMITNFESRDLIVNLLEQLATNDINNIYFISVYIYVSFIE